MSELDEERLESDKKELAEAWGECREEIARLRKLNAELLIVAKDALPLIDDREQDARNHSEWAKGGLAVRLKTVSASFKLQADFARAAIARAEKLKRAAIAKAEASK